jgi:hypothetical protein
MNPDPTTPSRRTGRDAIVLLERSRREENSDEIPRDRSHRQLAEELRLAGEPRLNSAVEAGLHGIDRRERRRVVPAGLLEHGFPRHTEDHGSPDRVSLQEKTPARRTEWCALPCDPVRRGQGGPPKDALRHELVHQAELERLRGALGLSGQDDVECGADSDQPRETLAPARPRKDPDLHFGQSNDGFRGIGRDPPAAGK